MFALVPYLLIMETVFSRVFSYINRRNITYLLTLYFLRNVSSQESY